MAWLINYWKHSFDCQKNDYDYLPKNIFDRKSLNYWKELDTKWPQYNQKVSFINPLTINNIRLIVEGITTITYVKYMFAQQFIDDWNEVITKRLYKYYYNFNLLDLSIIKNFQLIINGLINIIYLSNMIYCQPLNN